MWPASYTWRKVSWPSLTRDLAVRAMPPTLLLEPYFHSLSVAALNSFLPVQLRSMVQALLPIQLQMKSTSPA